MEKIRALPFSVAVMVYNKLHTHIPHHTSLQKKKCREMCPAQVKLYAGYLQVMRSSHTCL